MNTNTFHPFAKISRLNREIIITEKIDGANSAIIVNDDGTVYCQSRTVVLTSGGFGFHAWVMKNQEELAKQLGIGVHFGEWWGPGVGNSRNYGINEKRFSLFNTHIWHTETEDCRCIEAPLCYVVPTLAVIDKFSTEAVDEVFMKLKTEGSKAMPGFLDPEGIILYHTHSSTSYKVTFEYDDTGKGT